MGKSMKQIGARTRTTNMRVHTTRGMRSLLSTTTTTTTTTATARASASPCAASPSSRNLARNSIRAEAKGRLSKRSSSSLFKNLALNASSSSTSSSRGFFVVPSAAKGFLKELQELREESGGGFGGATSTSSSKGSKKLDFTLPLSILHYPNPKLRAKNTVVTVFDDKLAELAKGMFKVMYETDGIGLAAPQVGLNVQVMVFNPTGEASVPEEEVVLVNPRILNRSKGQTLFEEGCLSLPNIHGDIKRPKAVTLEAQDLSGKKMRHSLEGLEARIFLHEFDHLDGKLFPDRMAPQVFETVKSDLLAMEKQFEKENPGVKYVKY